MGPTGFIVTLLPWLEQTSARNDPLSCLFLFNKIRRKLLEKYYLFHFLKYFSNTLSSPLRLTSHNSTIDIETQRLEQRLRNQIRNTNGNIAITVLGFWGQYQWHKSSVFDLLLHMFSHIVTEVVVGSMLATCASDICKSSVFLTASF